MGIYARTPLAHKICAVNPPCFQGFSFKFPITGIGNFRRHIWEYAPEVRRIAIGRAG